MSTRRKRTKDDGLATLLPGEPYFVLRAQDPLAAEHVEAWAIEAELNDYPADKVAEARAIAVAMQRWTKK